MAWHTRRFQQFYYLSVRRNGRVGKQYFGNGMCGQLAADLVEQRKAERESRRRMYSQVCEQAATAEKATLELEQQCRLLTDAALMAQGLHRPQRRRWVLWQHGQQTLTKSES